MTSELRIKIAESLGWKWSKTITHECVIPVLLHGEDVYVNRPLPDLSDANAALQLVEVLKKEGWYWEANNTPTGVVFHFFKPHFAQCDEAHTGEATTFPKAICLAYCAVRGIAEKGKEA